LRLFIVLKTGIDKCAIIDYDVKMSYRDKLPKTLQATYDESLNKTDIEDKQIFLTDIALVDARIANLLASTRKAVSKKEILKVSKMLEDGEELLSLLREKVEKQGRPIPDEYYSVVAQIARAKGYLDRMTLSDEAWDKVHNLQKLKKDYIESQRAHNRADRTDNVSKKEFERELQRIYDVIVSQVQDEFTLNNILKGLGVIETKTLKAKEDK
jgi:hypothetical protein